MTKEIEVLDSLPGSGKTTAILKYMAADQSAPWLYLSPMLEQVEERIPREAVALNFSVTVPNTERHKTKVQCATEALEAGENIVCTHELTMHFSKHHIQLIKEMGYRVVCDEELNMIDGFAIKKVDIDHLTKYELITCDNSDEGRGRLSFNDPEMSYSAAYGDIKRLCDRGCLYRSKSSDSVMVTYLSPDLILAADRFILLTYNFKGTIMDTFLTLHGITNKELHVELYRDNTNVKEELVRLIQFEDTQLVKKLKERQNWFSLSATWYKNGRNGKERSIKKGVADVGVLEVLRCMQNLPRNLKVKAGEFFFTMPLDYTDLLTSKNFPESNHVVFNSRATNQYAEKKYAIHCTNVFMDQKVNNYLTSWGYKADEDVYALNTAIQWAFRGCIRERKPMKLTFMSKRMDVLFKAWLSSSKT